MKAAVQHAANDMYAIAAAVDLVKEKQAQATQPVMIKAGEKPDNSAVIAAREARKALARAKQAGNVTAVDADPRKAAVEAAIARAKARKQEQQASDEPVAPSLEPVDPRKAAIAAAIARAKAKKDAQQQVVNEE